ncbi:MAG: hypothetical protein KF708_23845 [Pirellulales bacterium]|nr:hypothetical protein [Pirellulales bacterium]
MTSPAIQLDAATFARAEQLAAERRCTVPELLRSLVEQTPVAPTAVAGDLMGLMSDEPELVDQIMDDVYRTRSRQKLRVDSNGSSGA